MNLALMDAVALSAPVKTADSAAHALMNYTTATFAFLHPGRRLLHFGSSAAISNAAVAADSQMMTCPDGGPSRVRHKPADFSGVPRARWFKLRLKLKDQRLPQRL
jgi:hypothetical protein